MIFEYIILPEVKLYSPGFKKNFNIYTITYMGIFIVDYQFYNTVSSTDNYFL